MYQSCPTFILIFSLFCDYIFPYNDKNNNPEINIHECIMKASVGGDLFFIGF